MSTWTDPHTGKPIPRPSAADRRPRRRAQVRTLRSPAQVRADLTRQADLAALRQLAEYVTTDPADVVALASSVLGPSRAAERAEVSAELGVAIDGIKLHRSVLPGRPLPAALVSRFAAAWRAMHRLDDEDRQERVVTTNGMSAKRARDLETRRRRAAAAKRSRQRNAELVASAWPRITPADNWPGVRTGMLW